MKSKSPRMKFLPRSHFRVGRSRTGLGLFAEKPIKKGTIIMRYRGKKIRAEKADELDNRYIYEINSRWSIDGSPRWNYARYGNHSCRPNAESDTRGHIVFVRAIKNIAPGDEITYDYGTDYFKAFIKPIGCKCVKCMAKRKAERAEERLKAKRAKARKAKQEEKLKEAAKLAARRKKAAAKAKAAKVLAKATTKPVVAKSVAKPTAKSAAKSTMKARTVAKATAKPETADIQPLARAA